MLAALVFLLGSGATLLIGACIINPQDVWALWVGRILPAAIGVGNLIVAGFLYLTFVLGK